MAKVQRPIDVPWPLSNNPGRNAAEGTGRLVNVIVEPTGDKKPLWRRAPGASVFARVPSSGSVNLDFTVNARGATFFSTFFELVGTSTVKYVGNSTGSFTYPAGTTVGDLVFIQTAADSTAMSMATPTGFVELATTVDFMYASLMWKRSTGEGSIGYTMAATTDDAVVSQLFTIRGAMSTAPVVDTATISTGASGDPHPTSFTATTADCLIITCAWMDDDVASAASLATTAVVAGATTFNCGGVLFAASTGAAGTAAASALVAFRPLATTGMFNFTTGNTPSWAVTGADDEWAAQTFTIRHD